MTDQQKSILRQHADRLADALNEFGADLEVEIIKLKLEHFGLTSPVINYRVEIKKISSEHI